MSRLRVLQLGPFPPPMGGVQANLVAIHRMLLDRGHESRVINLTRFRSQDEGGVHYPKSAVQVLRLLATLPSDVVHLHVGGDLTLRLLLLGLVCTALPGRRTVFTFHSGGYPESEAGRSAKYWTFRAFVLRRFDRLIAVNAALAEVFSCLGASPERTLIIPPSVVPDELPKVEMPEGLQRFYDAHSPVLVSMGWLEPEYDFEMQIRVLRQIRERWPNSGLAILGEGRLRPDLERARADSDAKPHILLAGDQPHEVALQAIARAGAFLRTTHYDGDSIAVRESLHLGTPVVASDNGMRPSGVILFPARDPAALVRAIYRALESPRPEPGPAGSGLVNIASIVDLYTELVLERRDKGR